jgi:hypothetical protein
VNSFSYIVATAEEDLSSVAVYCGGRKNFRVANLKNSKKSFELGKIIKSKSYFILMNTGFLSKLFPRPQSPLPKFQGKTSKKLPPSPVTS